MTKWCKKNKIFCLIGISVVFGLMACQPDKTEGAQHRPSEHPIIDRIIGDTIFTTSQDTSIVHGMGNGSRNVNIFISHVEVDTIGLDPGLSDEGKEMAKRLASLIVSLPLSKVYISFFRRTYLSVFPLVEAGRFEMERFEPEDVDKFIAEKIDNQNSLKLIVCENQVLSKIFGRILNTERTIIEDKKLNRIHFCYEDASGAFVSETYRYW